MKEKNLTIAAALVLIGGIAAGLFTIEQTRAGDATPPPSPAQTPAAAAAGTNAAKPSPATAETAKADTSKEPAKASQAPPTAPEKVETTPKGSASSAKGTTGPQDWWIPRHETGVAPQWPASMTGAIAAYDPVYRIPTEEKALYLTFDEGYENGFTPQIMESLSQAKVPATFFVTGQFVDTHPELVQEMGRRGFGIGNHTQNHPDMTKLSPERQKAELQKINDAVTNLAGKKPIHYRPPMGRFDAASVATAYDLGLTTTFWSIAYRDWEVDKQVGPEKALPQVMKQLHPGAVILLHAVSQDNTEMLPRFIEECRAQGYIFKPLPGEPSPR
ncbi:polysaccharide deacetylase family protein [Heliobacterium gestii]|uniref:Polysaccharide deacetylase family protein n=1 Tax=Heliomicrobium gestii TaxID=2699 RepID=A0A845L885_HELGE|nr:polysaccharide deacetylase family protein [Heliomicrobium gestii]MBM7868364.1 peptidoglycan-N-acetylmuramic acid deacetylase [Heliomicrobium gestii]MZP42428.1 polysaccharide deacetylase family protein [Heliomicrobium gestii]